MLNSDGLSQAGAMLTDRVVVTPVRSRGATPIDTFAVGALALVVRLAVVATSSGGFAGDTGYDQAVYFTAADALIHGRLPYADFVLLHPPGLMLVLTPFALLAQLIGDHPAFIIANVAFSGLGAVNAALVTRIASKWGLSRRAAATGGIFYAVWLSAVNAEVGARLEPLGSFAFLLGVLLLSRGPHARKRALLCAGAAIGFAVTVKIWWVVPLFALVGWYLIGRREARTARTLMLGALTSGIALTAPFFIAGPGEMWRMVIADQVGRNSTHASKFSRLLDISSLDIFGTSPVSRAVLLVAAALAAAVAAAGAWRHAVARPVVVVAAGQLLVLAVSPSYFGFYAGFLSASSALVLAAAVSSAPDPLHTTFGRVSRLMGTLVTVVAAGVTATAVATTSGVAVPKPLAVGDVPHQIRGVRCVMADSPMALIALDTLSRGLSSGCSNWVDVTGRTYDVDKNPGRHVARSRNTRWQRSLKAYLLSGDAFVTIRSATGISTSTRMTLDALPVIATHGRLTVRRSAVPRGTATRPIR